MCILIGRWNNPLCPTGRGSRDGASILPLAIFMALGLVSLGIAGISLARTADLPVLQDDGLDLDRGDAAAGAGKGVANKGSKTEWTVPAEFRELPRDLASILERGAEPLSRWSVFAQKALWLADDARVDGAAARVGSNGDIWVRGSAVVHGEARTGPYGRTSCERAGAVTGHCSSDHPETELPRVEVPLIARSSPLHVAAGGAGALEPGEHGFTSLELEAGSRLALRGPATVVVERLHLRAGAQILVDGSAGAVELHVLGDFVLASGAGLRVTDGSAHELRVHLAADNFSQAGAVIDFTGDAERTGGRIDGRVYAPAAAITLDGDFELHGGLVAALVRIEGRARVHGAQPPR